MIIPPRRDLSPFAIDRPALLWSLEHCLRSTRDGAQLTVLALIDLREFNQVNQHIGYHAGD
ncbi:hypothetical protein N8352_03660, partial [Porticoccaceae bacterium]|nr:hypothetical protein [Porticoccaceae bacterium]